MQPTGTVADKPSMPSARSLKRCCLKAMATGVGANGNHSLGVGTIGGMVIGTIALLFIVPVLYVIFQTIEERMKQRFHR